MRPAWISFSSRRDSRHPDASEHAGVVACQIYLYVSDRRKVRLMTRLTSRIVEHVSMLPEATPVCPAALLHLGSRAAVDQALSRLVHSEQLMRVCRGVYMRPVETRFGFRAPTVEKAIASLSALWGETIVPCGGAAANTLGLTLQIPVEPVYLTSGPSRRLSFYRLLVRLRHAPRWQLAAPNRRAGDLIRALAWLGRDEVEDGLTRAASSLSGNDLAELMAARATMPGWMATAVSALFPE